MIEPQLTMPDWVQYDDATHTYTVDGVVQPSVSTILSVIDPDKYAGIREDVLARAAARGSATHSMIALDVRNDLDVSSLEGNLVEDYLSWQKFCDDLGFECEYSERVVASKKDAYCGTLDLVGRLTKHKKKKGRWMVDIKRTAARPDMVDIQTAGYNVAAAESLPDYDPATPRGCLWIRGDRYEFFELTSPSDFAMFRSGLNVYNYRHRRK